MLSEHATHPRQLHEGASQGLRESELETKRPAKRIGVGGRGFTHGCHFNNAGHVRDGADSEWIIQLVNTRKTLGRLRLCLLDVDIHAKIKSYNPPQLLSLAVTGWCSDPVMIPLIPYSKGFVRVPHQVRKVASPMVSKALATAEIPTVSRARFSWNTWTMNCVTIC